LGVIFQWSGPTFERHLGELCSVARSSGWAGFSTAASRFVA